MQPSTAPERFFDPSTGGTMVLQLEPDGAKFRILRQLGYRDPHHPEPFIVPADVAGFRTDLASIPWFFAWLVPGIGTHLPAVLVHDALVLDPGEDKAHVGPDVDREEADRILRDAMASLGTPLVRRWLMWSAVILATAFRSLRPRWRWAPLVVGSLMSVAGLGAVATLDLLDVADLLPWMGERAWPVELATGAAGALLIPLATSMLWGRLWRAGAISGIALALLLHVTAALMLVYGLYWLLERVLSAPQAPRRARAPTSSRPMPRRAVTSPPSDPERPLPAAICGTSPRYARVRFQRWQEGGVVRPVCRSSAAACRPPSSCAPTGRRR